MSHSSYTASERRGILAVALVAMVLIGVGTWFSLWGENQSARIEEPEMMELQELVDTVALKEKYKNSKEKKKKTNRVTKKKKTPKKESRHRNPLEEPV